MSPGIFQDAFPRLEISGNPSYHCENKFLQCDTRGSRFQYLDLNVGLVLTNSAALVSPSPCSQIFLVLPGPNPQEDVAKFHEFSKRAEGGPSRAGRLSKTFPEVPIEFRVSSGNPESRLSIPVGLGIFMGWLGTWDAPELLAVCAS